MYIDFHTHGKLAKKLPFSEEYTHWLFSEAQGAGLDALCLTEHFNTWGFDKLYRFIADHSEREGDTLVFDGLRIFPGMETDIAEISGNCRRRASVPGGRTHPGTAGKAAETL